MTGHGECLRTRDLAGFMDEMAVTVFTCGWCWEGPGYPCRRSNGRPAWRTHEARRKAVINTVRDCGGIWPWD